ncbi:unnamed protein product [Psylliodes chrysocephalus]|uniref:Uncharacterized protein n=1 Tax=Psylliodes chrysocephalus TaxID=3402493 RepID=A0A9P0G6J2_9CUCU|nr:unnamed protein product [Psylliodes chrysocephala]
MASKDLWRPWLTDNEEVLMDQENDNNPELNKSENIGNEELNCGRKRIHLNQNVKIMIKNLFNCYLKQMNKTSAIRETARTSKISRATVYRIVKYGPYARKERSDKGSFRSIDKSLIDKIKYVIADLTINEIPTISNLTSELQNRNIIPNCSKTTLWRFLQANNLQGSINNDEEIIVVD